MTNLTLVEVLKSTPYLDFKVYSKAIASRNPEYVTAIKFHKIKAAIDQLIKTIGSATDKKWFADIRKYKKAITVCQSSDLSMFLGADTAMSLETPVFASEEADNFME